MDRARRRPGLLTGILVAAIGGAGPVSPAPLAAMRWTTPGADLVPWLTTAPPECLKRPRDRTLAWRIEVGRAAFRDPLLLGGQAARAGLSCSACHVNGRTNLGFLYPGVSGAPGTADVTSFVFSSHRGDHVVDPRPIPDLAGPAGERKINRDAASSALPDFIHGLITEEFDGAPPAASVMTAVTDYIRALDPKACPTISRVPLTATGALSDVRRAERAAEEALQHGDPEAAIAALQAVRAMLGRLYERYVGADLMTDAQAIHAADRRLAVATEQVRSEGAEGITALWAWRIGILGWSEPVLRDAPRSLYDPSTLARVISEPTR